MKLLDKMFHSPYQYSATILAKLIVNLATIIWSSVVLSKADALSPFSYYSGMTALMNEDYWATLFLLLSCIMMLRLLTCAPPVKLGLLAYLFLGGFWAYVWWGIVFREGPFWPASFASVSVVVILAVFSIIANPKRGTNSEA